MSDQTKKEPVMEVKPAEELSTEQLDKVNGGMMSATDNVIKTLGDGFGKLARKV